MALFSNNVYMYYTHLTEENNVEMNNKDKIILTDKNNVTTSGIKFPETPPPEVRYDGIFPTKEQIIGNWKNKLKRH